MTTLDTREDICHICERVRFGQIVGLGFGKWRHQHCAVGSEEWREYYHRLPETDRQHLTQWYRLMYPEKGVV